MWEQLRACVLTIATEALDILAKVSLYTVDRIRGVHSSIRESDKERDSRLYKHNLLPHSYITSLKVV